MRNTTTLRGFRGRDAATRAHDASNNGLLRGQTVTVTLADGSLVGAGPEMPQPDGSRDRMLWGAKSTHMLESHAVKAGLLGPYEPGADELAEWLREVDDRHDLGDLFGAPWERQVDAFRTYHASLAGVSR